jgi:hypothetical protein
MKELVLAALLAPALAFGQTWPTPTFGTLTLINPLSVANGGTGATSLTGLVTPADLATQAANTVLANGTGSTASPTAFAMPSCSTSASALNWTAGTGFTCNTAVVASNVSGTVAIANGGTGQTTQAAALTALLGSSTVPIANGGTNAATAAAALTNLGAEPIGNATNRDVYVSTAGNDSNSGAGWGLAKLTLQAAVNAAGTNGTVHVGSGTYSLTSALAMQPSTRLLCVDGAIITQPNAQNLSVMIDFSGNSANGASIQNCIIDGNRSGNTDNANNIMVYGATANDVSLLYNTIRNGSGVGVDFSTGVRPIVAYNKFSNFYGGPFFVVSGVAQTATYGQIVGNTISGAIGQHAITLNNSDSNIVSGNTINATLQTGMTVSTSGTTVTSTGGPNFSALVPGSFIILNGGTEFLITAIGSSTSMTVNTTPGTLTSVPAAAGPGDLISILSASHNTIANNSTIGGVGGGIVLSNFVAGESAQKNNVIGNTIYRPGEGCIELESLSTFSTQVFDNQIRGNNIGDCGVGGTAIAPDTQYGIALIDFNPNTLLNTFIDDNYTRDDQGTPTTQNWLGITSVAVGQVFVGKNTSVGTTNTGVANGISSVTLSAGWGSTASTSGITSYGDSFVFTVTSSGTGQSSQPSVTVNTRATTSTNPPVMSCQDIGGTGTATFVIGQIPGTNTSAALTVFVFGGTPVSGNTYTFLCRG